MVVDSAAPGPYKAARGIDDLVELLDRCAELDDEECVDVRSHGLQCADVLARNQPDDDELAIAGLVHDVGWVAGADAESHGIVGAALVRPLLGERIATLVELHVPAKRYLVTVDARYGQRLSSRSTQTLAAQGGVMGVDEVRAFEEHAHFADAIALRRGDEAAKSAQRVVPDLDRWRPVIEGVVERHRRP